MFNFFGKKNQLKEPQVSAGLSGKSNSAQTSTKVEDDVASFEIPDFTEDDLNFDLGMSEFMPEQDANAQPQISPKVVPPEATPSEAELHKPQETLSEAKPSEQSQEEQEEIPKFNVETSDDSQKTEELPELPEVKMKKEEIAVPAMPALPKHKPYGYSTEGIFVTEEKYKKTVILVDDTMKKAEKAQAIKTDSFMLSESKKQHVDKLSKLLKSITESLMDADTRLFEQGDAK